MYVCVDVMICIHWHVHVPIYNCCKLWQGPWSFVHPRGKMAPEAKPFSHGPQSQRATIVLLYLGNIVIPLLEVMLSFSNIKKTEQCIVLSWFKKQTNSSNKKQFFTCSLKPACVSYLLYLSNKLWSLIGWEPITWCETNMLVIPR